MAEPPPATVGQFLRWVIEDPSRVTQFSNNPDPVFEMTELSEADKELLKRGDLEEIRHALYDEGESLARCLIIILPWP